MPEAVLAFEIEAGDLKHPSQCFGLLPDAQHVLRRTRRYGLFET